MSRPDAAPSAADRAGRRRTRALLPGLAGALVALLAGAQPWWRATAEGATVAFSGTETTAGLSQALGVVALVGWLLVLVLRVRGRRVAGVLTALTGAGIVVVGVLRQQPSAATVRAGVREVTLADQFALTGSGWPWLYAAAGLLVVLGGALVTGTAARWPQRPDRFERSAAALATDADDDPAQVWRAQDAGLDPTEPTSTRPDPSRPDPSSPDPPRPDPSSPDPPSKRPSDPGPDVRGLGARDRMASDADPQTPPPPE